MRTKRFITIIFVMIMAMSLLSISAYAWKTEEEGPYRKGQELTTIYKIETEDYGNEIIVEKNVYLKSTDFKNRNYEKVKNENGYVEKWYNEKPVYVYMTSANQKYGYVRACRFENELDKAREYGWIPEDEFTLALYDIDGSYDYFSPFEINGKIDEGWYLYPVQILYSINGNSQLFKKSEVAGQLSAGWYEYPVCVVYAKDGTENIIRQDELSSYLAEGYLDNIDGFKVLYAPDGRQELVKLEDVAAQVSVGWYEEPVCIVYNNYGESSLIFKYELDYYRNNGWYAYNDTQTLYAADGKSETFYKRDVPAQLKAGWYLNPVCMVYDGNGNSTLIYESELERYINLGWSKVSVQHKRAAFDYLCNFIIQRGEYKSKYNEFSIVDSYKGNYITYSYDMEEGDIDIEVLDKEGYFIQFSIENQNDVSYGYISKDKEITLLGESKTESIKIDSTGDTSFDFYWETGDFINYEHRVLSRKMGTTLSALGLTSFDIYLLTHNSAYTLEDLGIQFLK